MKTNREIALEKAAYKFEIEDFLNGAKYLLEAYGEEGESDEILEYFNENFLNPNVEELKRIHDLNVEKMELDKQSHIFEYIPYFIFPIVDRCFFIYDSISKKIVTENFSELHKCILMFCTDENLSKDFFLEHYQDEIRTKELISRLRMQMDKLESMI